MKDVKDLLDIDGIKKFINDNNIEQLVVDSFWINFEKYKKECSKEFNDIFKCFDTQNLSVKIQNISIKLGNWPNCTYNHIVINMPIVYENKIIGKYETLFTFCGKMDDDFFVIY